MPFGSPALAAAGKSQNSCLSTCCARDAVQTIHATGVPFLFKAKRFGIVIGGYVAAAANRASVARKGSACRERASCGGKHPTG